MLGNIIGAGMIVLFAIFVVYPYLDNNVAYPIPSMNISTPGSEFSSQIISFMPIVFTIMICIIPIFMLFNMFRYPLGSNSDSEDEESEEDEDEIEKEIEEEDDNQLETTKKISSTIIKQGKYKAKKIIESRVVQVSEPIIPIIQKGPNKFEKRSRFD